MADRMATLLDQYGNPIKRSALKEEVAGPTLTGVRSPLTGYPGDGLNPRRLANLLREADEGEPLRYLELAEQIEERDPHYAGVLGTRKRSVAQLEIVCDAASDDQAAVDMADMVRGWLTRDELADELFDILDAVGKGWSSTEIIWDTSEGQWRPARLEWRDPRWFRFSARDGVTPLLRTDQGDQPLPGFKFIVARIKAKSGLPMRSGLARLAAWSWMFKAFTLRDWAIFTQTFGQPVRVGKYHSGATEEDKETLFRAVANIAGDCAAIIPEAMLIEFVESKNVGQGSDLYLKRCDWLDQQMSKAVLGQTATTDAIAGGHAVGQEHRQVQEDIERADARALAAILNRDLIRPWIDLEYGPQDVYPRLRIGRQKERDVRLVVDAVTRLVPMGLKVQESEMRDMLGLADPEEGADLLVTPAPGAATTASDLLPRQELQREKRIPAQDDIAAGGVRLAKGGIEAMLAHVRAAIAGASSLEDAREKLLALDLPAGEFERAMREALATAALAGRAEVEGSAGASS